MTSLDEFVKAVEFGQVKTLQAETVALVTKIKHLGFNPRDLMLDIIHEAPTPTHGTVATDEEMAHEAELAGLTILTRNDAMETFYDLCVDYGNWFAKYNGDVSKLFPDSRETFDTLLGWANEFNTKNVGRQWDGEYMEEVDDFFEAKVAELTRTA